jgi:hypothetical protein
LAVAYPVATVFAVVVTGNHYLLDAVGGALTLWAGYGLARVVADRSARREAPVEALLPDGAEPVA